MRKTVCAVAAACVLVPGAASASSVIDAGTTNAEVATESGSSHGLTWTARSLIVGQTSTATIPAGGNPIYLAFDKPGYSGVVGLLMRYENGSGFVCSGSLLSTGRILTAAHCVSEGNAFDVNGRAPGLVSTTAYFYDGFSQGVDPFVYPSGGSLLPGITAVPISQYHVAPGYTGAVIDQNDLAVLTLGGRAPSGAQGYELFTMGDLTGLQFNVAGYGGRSLEGGDVGVNLGAGRLRQGNNLYDYRLGDPAFDGFFSEFDENGLNFFNTTAQIEFSYISDFDNGLPAQSMACRVGNAVAGAFIPSFCTDGLGALEVGIAGGDSGGPNFIGGRIAGLNSYGLSFGTGFGDLVPGLQSSFGELNGYVPTFIHAEFIAAVPEPSTWAMMLLGFGSIGTIIRRRERKVRAALAC